MNVWKNVQFYKSPNLDNVRKQQSVVFEREEDGDEALYSWQE